MCKLSGSNIIQNYQNLMYANLGYEGKQALLITTIYGFMALVGQIFSIFSIADRWPRRRTVIPGWLTLASCLIILAVISALYGQDGSGNRAGQLAGIAFIFLFALSYSVFFNSAVWVIVAEIFPLELRAIGVGWSTFSQYLTAIWLIYGASYAFEIITWRFYVSHAVCDVCPGLCTDPLRSSSSLAQTFSRRSYTSFGFRRRTS